MLIKQRNIVVAQDKKKTADSSSSNNENCECNTSYTVRSNMANFVKSNEAMYQHAQQDTSSFGLVGFQVAHMQQPPTVLVPPPLPPAQQSVQHSLLNCGGVASSHEKPAYGQLNLSHPFIHHQQQQLHHHQHQHQHHHHHHQFLARHHHLANHATVMHYHHDEKRGKRGENVSTAYFPTGIIPLNASK